MEKCLNPWQTHFLHRLSEIDFVSHPNYITSCVVVKNSFNNVFICLSDAIYVSTPHAGHVGWRCFTLFLLPELKCSDITFIFSLSGLLHFFGTLSKKVTSFHPLHCLHESTNSCHFCTAIIVMKHMFGHEEWFCMIILFLFGRRDFIKPLKQL